MKLECSLILFLLSFYIIAIDSDSITEEEQRIYERYDPDYDEVQYDRDVEDHVPSIFDDPVFEQEHLSDFEFSDILSFPVAANSKNVLYEDIDQLPCTIKVVVFVAYGGALDIDFTLLDPSGRIIQQYNRNKEFFFVHNATQTGTYTFEFSNQMSLVTEKMLTFALHIDTKVDQVIPLKSEHLEPLGLSIDVMHDYLSKIEHLQINMRMRESIHRNTAESTNTRVVVFTIFQMVVLVIVKTIEIWYIQNMVSSQRVV